MRRRLILGYFLTFEFCCTIIMLLGTPEEAYVYTVTMFGLYFRVFLCKILECLENVTKIVYVNAASKCYLKM